MVNRDRWLSLSCVTDSWCLVLASITSQSEVSGVWIARENALDRPLERPGQEMGGVSRSCKSSSTVTTNRPSASSIKERRVDCRSPVSSLSYGNHDRTNATSCVLPPLVAHVHQTDAHERH